MKVRIDKAFSNEIKFFHFVKYIEYNDFTLIVEHDDGIKEEYFCPRGSRIMII